MGVYGPFIQSLYPDSHNVYAPVYSALLGAIGSVLDQYDPYQMDGGLGLKSEFSVTTAVGAALDRNGADWGVPRASGQSDSAYRATILAALAAYANGASDTGISLAVSQFTGVAPVIYDGSQDGYSPLDSAPADNAMSDLAGIFTLWIWVQNPTTVAYSHLNMETAVHKQLPARSQAIIYHNGTDTSALGEASNAVVTVVG